jgi:hypothetical protein
VVTVVLSVMLSSGQGWSGITFLPPKVIATVGSEAKSPPTHLYIKLLLARVLHVKSKPLPPYSRNLLSLGWKEGQAIVERT